MATQTKKRRVNLSALPPERKRAARDYLADKQPETLKLIESDFFQTLRDEFPNGSVIVEIEVESK